MLPPITEQPVEGLEMNHSLKIFFVINRIKYLRDLLRNPMSEWFNMKGFSQHLLQDLLHFLSRHDLYTFIADE